MQKLSGISSGKNNKSCGIFITNPTKVVLHFYDFSMIFYAIYKNRETANTIEVLLLRGGP
jgi:hypothetical protein